MVPPGHHVQSHYGPVAIVYSLLVAIVKHAGFIWGGNAQQVFIFMMMVMMSEFSLLEIGEKHYTKAMMMVCLHVHVCVEGAGSPSLSPCLSIFSFLSLSFPLASVYWPIGLLANWSIGQWSIAVKTVNRVNLMREKEKRKKRRVLLHCSYFCDLQT